MSYALVTGSSKGIGRAIAIELAKKKIDILLVARSEDLLKETAELIVANYGVKAEYLPIDLSQTDAPDLVDEWCKKNNYSVSILVNNAGYGLCGPFEKYTMNEYTNMLQVNLNALVKLCHIFLPHFKNLPKAFILNISSTTAYQSVPGLALYSASKSFVQSFSRSLSYELSKTNISVTCISPGGTDTDFVIRANIGIKALNIAKKFNMTPESVAKIAVNAMFNNKTEIVAGLINKIGVFLVWLLPKKIVERNVAKIYELN